MSDYNLRMTVSQFRVGCNSILYVRPIFVQLLTFEENTFQTVLQSTSRFDYLDMFAIVYSKRVKDIGCSIIPIGFRLAVCLW